MRDYKSLCLAVRLWAMLVNTETDRHTHRQLSASSMLLAQPV